MCGQLWDFSGALHRPPPSLLGSSPWKGADPTSVGMPFMTLTGLAFSQSFPGAGSCQLQAQEHLILGRLRELPVAGDKFLAFPWPHSAHLEFRDLGGPFSLDSLWLFFLMGPKWRVSPEVGQPGPVRPQG